MLLKHVETNMQEEAELVKWQSRPPAPRIKATEETISAAQTFKINRKEYFMEYNAKRKNNDK